MALTKIGKWVVRVPRGHYEEKESPSADGSRLCKTRTWVADEPEEREMEIEIDYGRLSFILGQRAAKAKGRKSKLLGGVIVATDLSRGSR